MNKSVYKDNRGLTLVELIVGVTILAIIIVPLLHTFIVGAGTELKSRQLGEATNAAQNLSEIIQSTDADTILGNSAVVASGATYATANVDHSEYFPTSDTTMPEADGGKYYIAVPSYSSGSSTYSAIITLDTSSAVAGTANTSPVVVGNQMDALLNMSQADTSALLELKTQYGYLMANPETELTLGSLTRSIVLTVTKSSSSPYTYTISASFNYTAGPITATTTGSDKDTTFTFTDTETSSASVSSVVDTTDGSPVLSAFLFYNAYYRSNITSENISINNQISDSARSDVKVFLVNTNTGPMPVNYDAQISYKFQNFNDADPPAPINNLVFTNIPTTNVTYNAYKDIVSYVTYTDITAPPINKYLVETKALNRKFNINIKIFKDSSNYSGTPIVSIDSTKLNY